LGGVACGCGAIEILSIFNPALPHIGSLCFGERYLRRAMAPCMARGTILFIQP
jgi:hypothetical protein